MNDQALDATDRLDCARSRLRRAFQNFEASPRPEVQRDLVEAIKAFARASRELERATA